MATRFLAVVPRDPVEGRRLARMAEDRTGYIRILDRHGLILLVEKPAEAILLDDAGGAILGWLFAKGVPSCRMRSVDEPTCAALARRDFSPLLTRYWGGYVAIARAQRDDHVDVLRDPSGGFPCFHLAMPAATLLFSDLATLGAMTLWKQRIDWAGLAWHLAAASLPSTRTALASIQELPCGFALDASASTAIARAVWSPWDYVGSDAGRGMARRVTALRDTVQHCVAAWASPFREILLNLSGGLDSSILAAGSGNTTAGWSAITMVTKAPSGDERRYARRVAEARQMPLTEAPYDLADVDIRQPSIPDLPRPIGRCIGQAIERPRRQLAERKGSEAFFTGFGGDNVFCFLQSPTPLADRLKAEGPGRGAVHSLGDVCRLTGCSVWTAARWAVERAWLRPAAYSWRARPLFLEPGVVDTRLDHPWLSAPPDALPGKAAHIAMLLRTQIHNACYERGASIPMIAPLLAQPIVELCLSIPAWQWCAGGRDRAVAREAFTGLVPDEIIGRSSKGGPEAFCYAVIERDRELLRERLLDGLLARHGIIDRHAIERVFTSEAPPRGSDFLRLLELADAEAWADYWSA